MPDPRFPDRLEELKAEYERSRAQSKPWGYRRSISPPPESTGTPGKRWTPAGVVLVLGAVSALSVTLGAVVTPLLTKPDLDGYVKEERLTACEARVTALGETNEKAVERERERTSACYDKLGACQSQTGAQGVVIESMGQRRKR